MVTSKDVFLEDLGSSNGTRIGGRTLARGATDRFATGSVAELGSATLVLQRARSLARVRASTSGGELANPAHVIADPAMRHLYSMLDLVAPTSLSVLILGETGVGKEVFAHEVHARSHRREGAFLRLNCAALPESTLEAELFGFERGSFTGALNAKEGLFEAADGGTVFLDEIGDMPVSTQTKILRVLESGEMLRLGSVKPKRIDVRIIAATNRDLAGAMAEGRFRSDLYFRLNGITFAIPPLRARRSESLPLAMRFIETAAARLGRKPPALLPETAAVLESRL